MQSAWARARARNRIVFYGLGVGFASVGKGCWRALARAFVRAFVRGDCKICKKFAKMARFCATICADR